jgi:hypothetical protein
VSWWRRRRSSDRQEFSSGAGPPKGLSLGRRVEIAAAAIGILVGGFVLGPKVVDFFSVEEGIRLEVAEPSVSNPRDAYRGIDQEAAADPTVAVTLRNRGTATAWIEEARITLVKAARLAVCVNQGGGEGDVPRTHDYRITLPEFPGDGRRVIRRDLHVQVQPGQGVRPVLSFKKDHLYTTNLYAIAVELVADPGGHTYDAGRFVIGVPGPVGRFGLTLPESEEVLSSEASSPGEVVPTWCFRHNLAAMRRVLAEPGERSAEIAALDHLQLAPGWNAYADHSPAPLVVEELLSSEDPEAALYAIEAARRSDDPRLEATVRRRAVAILLRQGQQELESYPPNAVASAERILSLAPSPAASRLLWRAKAAISAEEELAEAG